MPQRLYDINGQMSDCETILMYMNYLSEHHNYPYDFELVSSTMQKHFTLRKKYMKLLAESPL
jgi:hypothetical protein